MRIILIGFACSYKSTAGALLAKKINCKHIDVDEEITAVKSKNIEDIFATEGEAEFRKVESAVLRNLHGADDVVISCGGGSVLSEDFSAFSQDATIVWLTVTAETVCSRLGATARPLFDGMTLKELDGIISERNKYYSRYADVTVSTDGKTSEQVANELYVNLISEL